MNLWIRSQDKEILKKVKMLEIEESSRESYYIISDKYIIGEYKTKERALEVLDKIENFIIPKDTINTANYNVADLQIKSKLVESNMDRIFEMPNQ